MREIKFRGKRIDTGEWVYGGFYRGVMPETENPFSLDNARIKTIIIQEGTYYHVDPSTVGQFTGLKDKNGNEIYEGDILEEEPGYYFEVIWSVECAKFKLQWQTKAIQYPEWNRGVNMTVIGNRWDNPELLGESYEN